MIDTEKARPVSPVALLLLAITTLLYSWTNLHRLDNLHYLEWDLSIFAQGTFLLSRGETPFGSIRGLHLFGDHASYVHLLIAPLFWIFASVRTLVLVQSLALGALGFLLLREAEPRVGRVPALLVLAAFLLHPATQWGWLEYYQPDAIALPCLAAAYRALARHRSRAALLWSAAALITKENVAVTVFALGLYGLVTGRRRLGAWVCALAAGYLALVMNAAFPYFNPGQGYIYADRLYSAYGTSVWDSLRWLAHPDLLWQRLAVPAKARYLEQLFGPVAFLPLLAPLTLLIGVQLPLNLVSSWPYAIEIRYHYSLLVLPFLFLALIRALERFRPKPFRLGVAVGALLACLAGTLATEAPLWDAMRLSGTGSAELRTAVLALLARIPADASVSAHYRFLPRLCLRRHVYRFPDMGPAESLPDYVLVDLEPARKNEQERQALERIVGEGNYETIGLALSQTALFERRGARRASLALAATSDTSRGTRRSPCATPSRAACRCG